MNRRSIPQVVFLASTFLALLAGFCLAAPIDAIPDDAVVVVRVRSPKGLAKKATAFATKLDKEYEESLAELAGTIGTYFSNPNVEGAVGDWWLAVLEGSGGQNVVVMGAPVANKKDEDKFKSAIGSGFQFIKHEKYLFYTQDGTAAQGIKDRVAKKGKSISTLIDKASMNIVNQSDVGVFVNLKKLAEQYKPTIDSVSDELNKSFADWKNLSPNVEGRDLVPLFKMYGDAAKIVLQVVKDSEGYAAGIELTTKGATIEQLLKLKAGSPTDKLLQLHVPSDLKDLEKLADGEHVYVGMQEDYGALTQWWYKFTAELLKDEPSRKAMNEAAEAQASLKYGGYLFSMDVGAKDEGGVRTTAVTIAQPIEKLREITRKSAALLLGASGQGANLKVELKPDAEKIGTRSADVLTMAIEPPATNAAPGPLGILQNLIAAFFGSDGFTRRMVYLGDRVIMTSGGGKSAMEQAIAAQERTRPTTDKATPTSSTRKELPEKANVIVLADVPSIVVAGAKLMDEDRKAKNIPEPPAEGDQPPIKDWEVKPSYLGFSVTVGAANVSSTTYIPIDQAEGLHKLLKPYLEMVRPFLPF